MLFLEDSGRKPILETFGATVIAQSILRETKEHRYSPSDSPAIIENRFGKGRIVYSVCAGGDGARIEPPKAAEWFPGSNPPGELHLGHPDRSDSDPALSQFLFAMVARLTELPIVSLGHWPNGWRTVVSLTGDIHEFEEYYVDQSAAANKMDRFLHDRGLGGRFTYSVTGKALKDNPELFDDTIRKGNDVVPHSTVRATWLRTLETKSQTDEIDRCLAIFGDLMPSESTRGWRSHGWSGNGDTERILADRGVEWVSNLIAQRYGEFGRRDFHLGSGTGIAFVSLPEYSDTADILRLPNTMFSPDWIRTHILNEAYGVAKGPELDYETIRTMREHFQTDWRFEAMHLVDWHPWEELIAEPVFLRAADLLVRDFWSAENVGFMKPGEIAAWWAVRARVEIHEIEYGDSSLSVRISIAEVDRPGSREPEHQFNYALRFTSIPWKISRVTIDEREWRFFGSDWIALPHTIRDAATVIIEYPAPSPAPQMVDSTSLVETADLTDGNLSITLEERYLDTGRSSLYFPKPQRIYIDNILQNRVSNEPDSKIEVDDFCLGHHEIRYPKGTHHITTELP